VFATKRTLNLMVALMLVALSRLPAHAQSYGELQQAFENHPVAAVDPNNPDGDMPYQPYYFSYLDNDGWGEFAYLVWSGSSIRVRLRQNGFTLYGFGERSTPNWLGVRSFSFYALTPSGRWIQFAGYIAPSGWPAGYGEYWDYRGRHAWQVYR
jgi:hypothetical protein